MRSTTSSTRARAAAVVSPRPPLAVTRRESTGSAALVLPVANMNLKPQAAGPLAVALQLVAVPQVTVLSTVSTASANLNKSATGSGNKTLMHTLALALSQNLLTYRIR